jgi:peptidoglycan/xylan/chitin deacetylase (PgdA/CDA1 family)
VRDAASHPILMYHGVSRESSPRFRRFVVAPERFVEHMEYLSARNCRVCSISELVAARAAGSADDERKLVGLTFDDAFRELLESAVPVLRRLGFGATIYVPTAYIDRSSLWLAREGEGRRAILGADDLRDLIRTNVELGAHSHSHPALDVLPVDAARLEIERSKEVLEDTIESEVRSFSYPFGYESARVRRLVADAGYASACRVNYAMSPADEDVYGLSRLPVDGSCDLESFAALVSGDASLARRRALSLAWRPVRRTLARSRLALGG